MRKLKFKWLIHYSVFIFTSLLFAGCPSSDEDEEVMSSPANQKFIGIWEGAGTTNPSILIFSEDGQVIQGNLGSFSNYGRWSYDKETGLLATTLKVEKKSSSYQWEVSIIDDRSWSGFKLWEETKNATIATRPDSIQKICALLTGVWDNPEGELLISSQGIADNVKGMYFGMLAKCLDDYKQGFQYNNNLYSNYLINVVEYKDKFVFLFSNVSKAKTLKGLTSEVRLYYPYNFSRTYLEIDTYYDHHLPESKTELVRYSGKFTLNIDKKKEELLKLQQQK